MKKELIKKIIDADPDKAVRIITNQDPKTAYNLIFEHPDPPAVAKALPFEDAFLIVKSVGRFDSIDLVEILDREVIQGFFDLDCWDKDRLSKDDLMDWVTILMELDDKKFMDIFNAMDNYLKVALFKGFAQTIKIEEPDENPYLGVKDVFMTPDNRYALKISGTEDQKRLLFDIAMRIYRLDQERFYWLLEGIYWETASFLEENAYQEKVGRLSEKGFPEYYFALEALTLVNPDKFKPLSKVVTEKEITPEAEKSNYLVLSQNPGSLFRRSLALIEKGSQEVQLEVISLANMVSMAYKISFADYTEVGHHVRMVDGYLSIALEHLAGNNPEKGALVLFQKRLLDLYKIGRSFVIKTVRPVKSMIGKIALDQKSVDKTLLEGAPYDMISGFLKRDPIWMDENGKKGVFSSMKQIALAKEKIIGISRVIEILHDFLEITPVLQATKNLTGTNQLNKPEVMYTQLFCTSFANDMLDREFFPINLSVEDCLDIAKKLVEIEGKPSLPKENIEKFFLWVEDKIGKTTELEKDFFNDFFTQMAGQLKTFRNSPDRDIRYLSTLIVKIPY